jgi:hypothetical protein
MHLRTAALVAIAFTSLTPHLFAQGKAKGGNPGGGWLSSLAEGKAVASKTGKPIMFVLRCQP